MMIGSISRMVVLALMASVSLPAQAQNKRKKLVFEDTVIEGQVQKPQITIFITRQNLDTEASLELRESFIPKIVESVEKKPF